MPLCDRLRWLLVVGLAGLFLPSALKASLCLSHNWTLKEIADDPVLVVGHVVSLGRESGPHFTGDPKQSAIPQRMTAEVDAGPRFSPTSLCHTLAGA
jgi:hypothetical protein